MSEERKTFSTDLAMPAVAADFIDGRDDEAPVVWHELFGLDPADMAGRPIEVEIGCGNGRYIRRAADERPDHLFLGIERSLSYARKARDRMVKYAVPNVRIVRDDATKFLASRIPPASVDALHVYFTDPWPKNKHARRRIFQTPFFDTIHRILKPDAPVFVKVDLFWYFEEILGRFEANPWFALTRADMDTDRDRDIYEITGFEQKALERKGAVYYLAARHVADGKFLAPEAVPVA